METCLPGADVISPTLPPPVSSDQPLCCGDNPPTSTLPSLSPLAPLTTTSESDSDCDHHSQGRRFGESFFFFFPSPLLLFVGIDSVTRFLWTHLKHFGGVSCTGSGLRRSVHVSQRLPFFLPFFLHCVWISSQIVGNVIANECECSFFVDTIRKEYQLEHILFLYIQLFPLVCFLPWDFWYTDLWNE